MNLSIPISGTFIKVSNKCNLNCGFCPLEGCKETSFEDVLNKLKKIPSGSNIILSGGEPFVRKDILSILENISRLNLKTFISTNGRIFFYKDLTRRLSKSVSGVIYSLFLPDEKLYYRITGAKEGFNQSYTGLYNIVKLSDLIIEIRYPLTEETIRRIDDLLKLLDKIKTRKNLYIVLFLPSVMNNRKSIENIFKNWSEYSKIILRLKRSFQVYFEDLPVCLSGGEVIDSRKRFDIEDSESAVCPFVNSTIETKKSLECSECLDDRVCKGIPLSIPDVILPEILKPSKGVRSNSFDYILIKEFDHRYTPGMDCNLYRIFKFRDPERYILTRDGEKIQLYYTDTESFSDEEIRETKLIRQQLYLDVSKKAALDDFQKDIQQLQMDRYCSGCKNVNRCPAFFERTEDIPFEREERWIRQEIKRLVGRVLDIGCGDMRFYKDIINDLLKREIIEYYGIDVDEKALRRLRRDIPGAKVIKSSIEDFKFQASYFDYIFSLRSLNHFYDMKMAFDRISSLLRSSGMLIIADTVVFALLRPYDKVLRVRSSRRPVFEHYRNWSSEQLIEFLRENNYPFKLDTHKPVRNGTSNQWIVKLMKIEEV
jgi:MoaA/NifB/PqqE/SkfB family radical SAM enzyme/SAM-dependent methyltransferase